MTNREVINEWLRGVRSDIGIFRLFCRMQSSCSKCILSECPLRDECIPEWMDREYKPRDDK